MEWHTRSKDTRKWKAERTPNTHQILRLKERNIGNKYQMQFYFDKFHLCWMLVAGISRSYWLIVNKIIQSQSLSGEMLVRDIFVFYCRCCCFFLPIFLPSLHFDSIKTRSHDKSNSLHRTDTKFNKKLMT